MRAAGNHRIQSTGAGLTKELQAELWTLQPGGIYPWYIQPMNIHDEIMAQHKPELAEDMKDIVDKFVDKTKEIIPMVGVDWQPDIDNWSGKGGAKADVNDEEQDAAIFGALEGV